jgi:hypothetical protein
MNTRSGSWRQRTCPGRDARPGGCGSVTRCQGMAGRVDQARELTNGTLTNGAGRIVFVASLLAMTVSNPIPLAMADAYSGAALLPRAFVSLEASEATTITTAIKPITSVQMALISGFTPSRTSE